MKMDLPHEPDDKNLVLWIQASRYAIIAYCNCSIGKKGKV